MNRNQSSCPICHPTSKTNRKILNTIKKLVIIFKINLQKSDNAPISYVKSVKSNFFYRLVQYQMLGVDSCQQKQKHGNCQKHQKLKRMMAANLKVSTDELEHQSEILVGRILKGKFELSMVLHLSKNIAQSRVLKINKQQFIEKAQQNATQRKQEDQILEKERKDKLKGQTGTISENSQEKEITGKQRANSGLNERLRSQEYGQNVGNEAGIMWYRWMAQCHMNQIYYQQYYLNDGQ